MTKKRSSEIFAAKMGILSEKSHLSPREIFPSPQARRQVSATGFGNGAPKIMQCVWELMGSAVMSCHEAIDPMPHSEGIRFSLPLPNRFMHSFQTGKQVKYCSGAFS